MNNRSRIDRVPPDYEKRWKIHDRKWLLKFPSACIPLRIPVPSSCNNKRMLFLIESTFSSFFNLVLTFINLLKNLIIKIRINRIKREWKMNGKEVYVTYSKKMGTQKMKKIEKKTMIDKRNLEKCWKQKRGKKNLYILLYQVVLKRHILHFRSSCLFLLYEDRD